MRPFTIVEAEQRTAEWFAARVGRLTGSRAGDMLATTGKGEAAARRDLRAQLVVERLTSTPQEDGYVNAVMQRGIDKEPDAFAAYEAVTGHLVRRTGFLSHTSLMLGCSLDGDIEDFTGIVELKCPKSATHLEYLKSGGKIPTRHVPQITHNLFVSGAQWCDFASFDDRFPLELQLVVMRVMRDDAVVKSYELALTLFLSEVDKEVETVKALIEKAA